MGTSISEKVAALVGAEVAGVARMHGGDLSAVYRVALADGRTLAAKVSSHAAAEAAMLRAIRATGAPAPGIVATGDGLFVMDFLDAQGGLASAWDDLAKALAKLHASRGRSYGWPGDYSFGEVDIRNATSGDWPAFWAEHRLLCHAPHLPAPLAQRIERLARSLHDRLPLTPAPSLLHGDLWGGNVLVRSGRVTGLIDPACYHGDREVDVAMLTLFDHPPDRFFDALQLDRGWRERQPVYRLWPWLVHLRLFGSGYRGTVDSCLSDLGV